MPGARLPALSGIAETSIRRLCANERRSEALARAGWRWLAERGTGDLLRVERVRARARTRVRVEPLADVARVDHRHAHAGIDVSAGGISAVADRSADCRDDRRSAVQPGAFSDRLGAFAADALSHYGADGGDRAGVWLSCADHRRVEVVSGSPGSGERPRGWHLRG